MGAVTIFVLIEVVYSSVKTAIHVRSLGKIVVWSESQPTVYADLRQQAQCESQGLSLRKYTPGRLHLACMVCLVLACYRYNRMHLLEQKCCFRVRDSVYEKPQHQYVGPTLLAENTRREYGTRADFT